MTIDGKQTEWNNPSAPVTVSIPYKPTAAELANPESIVIWYIDGSGRAVSVPNGHYDAATGTVTFETTHFSLYTITYNPVSFNDVASGAWYDHVHAVQFIPWYMLPFGYMHHGSLGAYLSDRVFTIPNGTVRRTIVFQFQIFTPTISQTGGDSGKRVAIHHSGRLLLLRYGGRYSILPAFLLV